MRLNNEPTLIIGAIGAIIAVAVGFGLPVTPAQVGLIMAAVSAVLALIVRSQVTPEAKVDKLIKEAVKSPASTTVATVKASVDAKEEAGT